MTLRGKVAIVTGGNSGIEKGIDLTLAEAGVSVVIDYEAATVGPVVLFVGDGASYLAGTTSFADGDLMHSSPGL